jgi:hypothetical protein
MERHRRDVDASVGGCAVSRGEVIFSGFIGTAIAIALMALVAVSLSGCASRPPLSADSFPDAIAAQCERAKAQAIRQYGQPPCPYWCVTMKRGEKWGKQWAINLNGVMVGGYTAGSFTTIGCGPNGEINYNDLLHEAGEYATWQDGRMHR